MPSVLRRGGALERMDGKERGLMVGSRKGGIFGAKWMMGLMVSVHRFGEGRKSGAIRRGTFQRVRAKLRPRGFVFSSSVRHLLRRIWPPDYVVDVRPKPRHHPLAFAFAFPTPRWPDCVSPRGSEVPSLEAVLAAAAGRGLGWAVHASTMGCSCGVASRAWPVTCASYERE
ncbi:hypothetical protein Mp_5g03500 [Marchantia polymorpha subsp. ruderalis]|uniref:Uncharacterized protein n=2 Tax=Marchantia polymorpha TaxID=3197 RepID=A0AAF6BEJ7_MARPO|nr:hypothetical protein MARPO_0133s0037 [Marchantia polymorpha]BBN10431.1 hypothetical protein Mp_5g03500 [Marchantia polymorpha subsp. ruderalis]|eukprot:PTQ29892.1 hypothetical protein MARPO_0133s0037 [Marchantia polymorpha]